MKLLIAIEKDGLCTIKKDYVRCTYIYVYKIIITINIQFSIYR
jgi:hypothetical protein